MTNAQKRSLPRPMPHAPVAASHGIRREVSQKFSPQGGCTRAQGRQRAGRGGVERGGAGRAISSVVYCSPKCFYLTLRACHSGSPRRPRPQLGKEGNTRAGWDLWPLPATFRLFYYLLLSSCLCLFLHASSSSSSSTSSSSSCLPCCCSFTLLSQSGQAKLAVKMY